MSTDEDRIINPGDPVAPQDACASLPDLIRLRYVTGLMLTANDFLKEQDYFREKLKLHNRCLHGYGTVCGLKVVPLQTIPPPSPPTQQKPYEASKDDRALQPSAYVQIECGLALDCEGNELLVRNPLTVDLWKELTDRERDGITKAGSGALYLSICYCVQAIDPVRPVIPDSCSAMMEECVYSKLRDSVHVKVATSPPAQNRCGEACCTKCADKCLLLARIDFVMGHPVTAPQIHNDVRRWTQDTYDPTVITGISWVHGADNYTPDEAFSMMHDQGLTIELSRPILPDTVANGVLDVWKLAGGGGVHGEVHFVDGDVSVEAGGREILFKQTSDEYLQNGDRLMVMLRADFILDECCRPVDGNHVGGRVPLLDRFKTNKPSRGMPPASAKCVLPPRRYEAWTSGNGSPGGTFESWFYVKRIRPNQTGQAGVGADTQTSTS
jgi:hypothetical protein